MYFLRTSSKQVEQSISILAQEQQQQRSQVQLKTGSFFADLVTDPKLPFNEHLATAHNASLFGCKVKVAGPKTLRLLLAESDEFAAHSYSRPPSQVVTLRRSKRPWFFGAALVLLAGAYALQGHRSSDATAPAASSPLAVQAAQGTERWTKNSAA